MGGMGSPLGGILGGVLGGAMGRRGGLGGRDAMLMMLLPLAMQWVQRNGGIGQVMQRMGQRGYGRQASSWVGTGDNEPLDLQAVRDVVGRDELSRFSQELGVPDDEVADGFAEILPEMVDKLSPDGQLPDDADRVLGEGHASISDALSQLEQRQPG